MRVLLLGMVQVIGEGRLVRAGAGKQSCVLAALALTPGRPVSAETLIDRVWGDDPPRSARDVIYQHLSRFRGLGFKVRRSTAGYLLEIEEDEVDVHRCRAEAAAARAAMRDGDAASAALRFREALRLWRGTPLGGVGGDWAAGVRDALTREHLTLLGERFDAELLCSAHAQVLPELSAACSAHPLAEALAGQLMLALFRCGRGTEALEYYAGLRRRIRDELGLDPGPALRDLHARILRQDVSLIGGGPEATVRWPVEAAGARAVAATPRQLPADISGFTGRTTELSTLDKLLDGDGPRTVCICGSAGVGKTSLAVHWAHRVADRFADGQLYVNLRGFDPDGPTMSAVGVVRGFLDALGVPAEQIPPGLDAQAGLYRTLLAGKRVLVVLDNARDADHVRPLLPGASTAMVVITSRRQLTGLVATDSAHPLTVGLLSAQDAGELLAQRLGAERTAAESTAVERIINACARLPLALTIAAALAQETGFALPVIADELDKADQRLDYLDTGDPASHVRTVFSWSYRALPPPAARLFRLLGVHPGPDITVSVAASLAGIAPRQARTLLADLTRSHMLAEHSPGRYGLHDLLRIYACEQSNAHDSGAEQREAMQRTLDHYLHTAQAACRLLDPHRDVLALDPPRAGVHCEAPADRVEARSWLTAEGPVLLAAIAAAASGGLETHAWQLAWILVDHFDYTGRYHDLATTQQAALQAAQRLGDRRAQAYAHRGLGGAHAQLGPLTKAQAHYRWALGLFMELDEPVGQAFVHLGLGRVLARQTRFAEALEHALQALDLYQTAQNRAGQARAANAVGWYQAQAGNYREALVQCRRALVLQRALGDGRGEANTLHSLGYAYQHLGQHREAVTRYRQAHDLFAGLGDQYDVADTLGYLGDAHLAAGENEAARDVWHQALDIFAGMRHPDAERVRARLRRLNDAEARLIASR